MGRILARRHHSSTACILAFAPVIARSHGPWPEDLSTEALHVRGVGVLEVRELAAWFDAAAQPIFEIDSLPSSQVDVCGIKSLRERNRRNRSEFVYQFEYALHDFPRFFESLLKP
jgi:hypothetical protein